MSDRPKFAIFILFLRKRLRQSITGYDGQSVSLLVCAKLKTYFAYRYVSKAFVYNQLQAVITKLYLI